MRTRNAPPDAGRLERVLRRTPWPVCGMTLGILIAAIWLGLLNGATFGDLSWLVFVAACAIVGALVTSRCPTLIVGWLFVLSALSFSLMQCTAEYALYGLVTHPGALPWARALVWPQSWLPATGIIPVAVFLPLMFPNGRAVSMTWRRITRAMVVLSMGIILLNAIRPGGLLEANHGPALPNPLGVDGLHPVLAVANIIMPLLLATGITLGAISQRQRYRSSTGIERRQIKWFMLAVSALSVVVVVSRVVAPWSWLTIPALVAIPVSVAIALLRYHLYDVDVIIRRTLVYGLLTVTLGVLYLAVVLALQSLARALTGQSSELAVAAATLAAVAVFSPLRRRVHDLIDRAFYRRRYDAAQVLTTFGDTCRDETDLERLRNNLVRVVDETMQPGQVTLWLPDR